MKSPNSNDPEIYTLTLYVTRTEYRAWDTAKKAAGETHLEDWARKSLSRPSETEPRSRRDLQGNIASKTRLIDPESFCHIKAGDKVVLVERVPMDRRLYQKFPKLGRLYCVENVVAAITPMTGTTVPGISLVGLRNIDPDTGAPTVFNARHFVRVEDVRNYQAAVAYRKKSQRRK